ncbi:MAG: DUF169 domain-containing protein [Bacteroidales bacterium]|nr:DUF169 domain-containing protein [Bacteroidales bacterium]
MDIQIRDRLMEYWEKYFPNTELPLAFFYSTTPEVPPAKTPSGHRCIFADINKVRKGESLAFHKDNIGCWGGQKYAGYRSGITSTFPYFLSCGIEGELEGERYKKDPELVKEMMDGFPEVKAGDKSLVFKRWDKLTENDRPEVVICYAKPDAISGLFMLANYDRPGNNNVISTMGSGCSQTILYPYLEKEKEEQKAFLGMFDPSARPFIQENLLSFATPYDRFVQMVKNMDESFLITKTWDTISNRMKKNTT